MGTVFRIRKLTLLAMLCMVSVCSSKETTFIGFVGIDYRDKEGKSYFYGDKLKFVKEKPLIVPLLSVIDGRQIENEKRALQLEIVDNSDDDFILRVTWLDISKVTYKSLLSQELKGLLNSQNDFIDLLVGAEKLDLYINIDKEFTLEEIKERFGSK
jgi:hypothetical protein